MLIVPVTKLFAQWQHWKFVLFPTFVNAHLFTFYNSICDVLPASNQELSVQINVSDSWPFSIIQKIIGLQWLRLGSILSKSPFGSKNLVNIFSLQFAENYTQKLTEFCKDEYGYWRAPFWRSQPPSWMVPQSSTKANRSHCRTMGCLRLQVFLSVTIYWISVKIYI